jgi:cytochrome c oxidase assembly factor CtaG
MDPVTEAVLRSWRLDPWLATYLVVVAAVYVRGWLRLHKQLPRRFGTRRLVCFSAGLAAIFVALASPLDSFASLLLQVHMAQHLLLAMIAPPLILAGAPVLPLLRGLPRSWFRSVVAPILAAQELAYVGRVLTNPIVCWLAFTLAMVTWHVPVLYELALRSMRWHVVQHACFFGTGTLFWWPVIQPWPSRARWPRWSMIAYLVFADLQNTALSAFLIFCDRVVYPTYASGPRIWGISALDDQVAAGALMWVPGSIVFLVPAGWIALQLLGSTSGVRPSEVRARAASAAGVAPTRRRSGV